MLKTYFEPGINMETYTTFFFFLGSFLLLNNSNGKGFATTAFSNLYGYRNDSPVSVVQL
jgi:hypothetical protein